MPGGHRREGGAGSGHERVVKRDATCEMTLEDTLLISSDARVRVFPRADGVLIDSRSTSSAVAWMSSVVPWSECDGDRLPDSLWGAEPPRGLPRPSHHAPRLLQRES